MSCLNKMAGLPGHSDPIGVDEAQKWLEDAARYFEARPTVGEDQAHWANVYNASNCRRIAALLETLAAK